MDAASARAWIPGTLGILSVVTVVAGPRLSVLEADDTHGPGTASSEAAPTRRPCRGPCGNTASTATRAIYRRRISDWIILHEFGLPREATVPDPTGRPVRITRGSPVTTIF